MDSAFSMWSGFNPWIPVFILFLHIYTGLVAANKCYKNEELGDVSGNVYQCDASDKPECCQQGEEFTCCEKGETRNLIEQIQLWGIVGAIALIIAVLLFCLCKDVNYCSSEKTVKENLNDVFCRRNNKLGDISGSKSDCDYDDIQSGPSTSPVTSFSSNDPSTRPTSVEKH